MELEATMPAAFSVIQTDGSKLAPGLASRSCRWRVGGDVYEVAVWTDAEWWAMSERARMANGQAQPCGGGHWVLLRKAAPAPP